MSGRLQVGSVAFNTCLYFAVNPGATLFSDEIRKRWVTSSKEVSLSSLLSTAKRNGYLKATKVKGEPFLAFSAGPELTKLLETL